MRHLIVVSAAVLAVAGIGSVCRAQIMGMTRGMSGYMLLSLKEVQKELKLKPDQLKQLQEKQKAMGEIGKSKDPSAMANAMAMMGSTDLMEKSVSDVLDAGQASRFHELLLQHDGPAVLNEPSVAKALDLTSDQKSRVSVILGKADEENQSIIMGLSKVRGNGGLRAIRKKMDELKKSTADSLIAVLTPSQAAQWERLQGDKFKFPKTADGMM